MIGVYIGDRKTTKSSTPYHPDKLRLPNLRPSLWPSAFLLPPPSFRRTHVPKDPRRVPRSKRFPEKAYPRRCAPEAISLPKTKRTPEDYAIRQAIVRACRAVSRDFQHPVGMLVPSPLLCRCDAGLAQGWRRGGAA
ncbi:unnamed protein product [Tuber aestivum]|uniref:Uncharacterized protein n=1 Tax=Tuber aestivum TaxID=59557 RepID=A0A292PX47_9PEZI|nr:unnamed protein product [Tuber aestivum]